MTGLTAVGGRWRGLAAGDAIDVIVDQRTTLTPSIVQIDFRAASGEALPRWPPGAHLDLELDQRLVRQYSLCGDTEDASTLRITVALDPASAPVSPAALTKGSSFTVELSRSICVSRSLTPRIVIDL